VKPLAIRSMTVAGRLPARNSCIALTISAGSSPTSRGTGDTTPAAAAWQPEHAVAPAGAAAFADAGAEKKETNTPVDTINARIVCIFMLPKGRAAAFTAAALPAYTSSMPWFLSGNERMRLPVAAKNAFNTAGAATQIVGSPTPPQKPPEGMMIDSTFGICAMRIEL